MGRGKPSRYANFAIPVSSVIITPGDWFDWVGVDNISFTEVPEPGSITLLALATPLLVRPRRF